MAALHHGTALAEKKPILCQSMTPASHLGFGWLQQQCAGVVSVII